ncbi:hypothetical protein WJ971_04105 [Achromobacter xylosoxidans]
MQILPLALAVFVGFFMVGLPMPVLPLYVDGVLAQGALVVGIVAGLQFAAALLSRAWSGSLADRRGAKRAVVTGFLLGSGRACSTCWPTRRRSNRARRWPR